MLFLFCLWTQARSWILCDSSLLCFPGYCFNLSAPALLSETPWRHDHRTAANTIMSVAVLILLRNHLTNTFILSSQCSDYQFWICAPLLPTLIIKATIKPKRIIRLMMNVQRERERKAGAYCRCYLASQLNGGIYPEDCLNVKSYLDNCKYQKAGFVAPPE